MANAGYSKDYWLIKKVIREQRYVRIYPEDNTLIKIFKTKINNLLDKDVIEWKHQWGTKYLWHSVYPYMHKVAININKLRQQNWFWEPINE